MSCKQCDVEQDNGNIAYYRWGAANIGMSGCSEHLREIFAALNKSQTP